MSGPLGEQPTAGALDFSAVAADDDLLNQLGLSAGDAAVTWDGAVDEPTPITDAVIWTGDPILPPVKKPRSEFVDPAAALLGLVLADADAGLSVAAEKLRASWIDAAATPGVTWGLAADGAVDAPTPGVTWGLAADGAVDAPTPGVTWGQAADGAVDAPTPGVTWGRFARRTGTRGAAVLAALAVSVGGVAAASVTAGPGNPLYPVHKLFAGPNPVQEQAYAIARVTSALDEAQRALDEKKPGRAHGKLSVAQARLGDVTDGAAKDALKARWMALTALVTAATPEPSTSPTDPAPSPSESHSTTPTPTPTPNETSTPTVSPSPEPSGDPSTEPGHKPSDHPTGDGQGKNGLGNGGSGTNNGGDGLGGKGHNDGRSVNGDGSGNGTDAQGHGGKGGDQKPVTEPRTSDHSKAEQAKLEKAKLDNAKAAKAKRDKARAIAINAGRTGIDNGGKSTSGGTGQGGSD